MMQRSRLSSFVLGIASFGLLLVGGLAFSGCFPSSKNQAEQKEQLFKMEVVQVDQALRIADKLADGQFLVVKIVMKNLSNKTLVVEPADFTLENITDDEKERYSQPPERAMVSHLVKAYGKAHKDRFMDLKPTNLYPRLQVERYFVFMVPGDARLDQYQMTYAPHANAAAKASIPLVTNTSVINDHRNDPVAP